jgi:predicted TIM-barrel fold metal-dependent hydrolase
MKLDDMIIVSVDDHVVEPHDLFEGRVARRFADRAPKVVHDEQRGAEAWTWEGGTAGQTFVNAVVTLPNETWGMDPASLSDIRPSCYDVHERIRDMNRNGTLASMCFPSFANFTGGFFSEVEDHDLGLACLQAYNDWHIDGWCGAYPGRLLPLALPALWDPEVAAAEVRRVAKKGCRTVCFTEAPYALGYPSIHSGHWDPFFRACVDENMVVSIHIGSALSSHRENAMDALPTTSPDAPIDIPYTMATQVTCKVTADYIWGDVFKKFPALRIALSEGGFGWVPAFLDRMDRHYDRQRAWLGTDLGGKIPSEVFREHFLTCFISEPAGLRVRDVVGIDNIAYEVDFPHSDCDFPECPERLLGELEAAGCNDEEIEKISWRNAVDFFGYDPFKHVPREQATVGALRAQAQDVDVSVTTKEEYRRRWEAERASA